MTIPRANTQGGAKLWFAVSGEITEINAPDGHSIIERGNFASLHSFQLLCAPAKGGFWKFLQIILSDIIPDHFVSMETVKPFDWPARLWSFAAFRCGYFFMAYHHLPVLIQTVDLEHDPDFRNFSFLKESGLKRTRIPSPGARPSGMDTLS